MNRAMRILIAALLLTLAVLGYVVWFYVISPTTPVLITGASLERTSLRPGETLRVVERMEFHASPQCFSGSQRVLGFPDGSEAILPGTRRAVGEERQTVYHEIVIPENAPRGRASVQIREVFICGLPRIEGPVLEFEIR